MHTPKYCSKNQKEAYLSFNNTWTNAAEWKIAELMIANRATMPFAKR
jgi:hypothetical protein